MQRRKLRGPSQDGLRRRIAVFLLRPFAAVAGLRRFRFVVPPNARCTRREIVRKPLSTFLLVDDAPARSDSFATCRCSFLFVLISSATIAFNLSTSSPPPARLRRLRLVFEPGRPPRPPAPFHPPSP